MFFWSWYNGSVCMYEITSDSFSPLNMRIAPLPCLKNKFSKIPSAFHFATTSFSCSMIFIIFSIVMFNQKKYNFKRSMFIISLQPIPNKISNFGAVLLLYGVEKISQVVFIQCWHLFVNIDDSVTYVI